MSFRLTPLAVACAALVGSLLAAAPAEAAGKVVSNTSVVAMSSSGYGKVLAKCASKKTCKGKIWISGAGSQARSFSIGGRKTKYITFRYTGWRTHRVGTLNITGAKARRVTMEAPVTAGRITGTVARVGGPTASNIEVELWAIGTHQRDRLISKRELAGGSGAYSFTVRMGTNNGPSAKYKIHVTGTSGGQSRSWWWRGGNGSFAGGTREISSGSAIQVTRGAGYRYTANARYSSFKGTVTRGSSAVSGTEVTLIGRPPYWSRSSRTLADLDFMSCANVYGRDTTDGAGRYEIGFVPTSSARIYAVKSEGSQWNNRYGTCHAAVNYRNNARSTPTMMALTGGSVTRNLSTTAGRTNLKVRVSGYQGQSSTAGVDRYVTVREYAKGRAVLKSDVVRASQKDRNFTLGEGLYWVEVGRRTGCQAWYSSRYKDNNGYFNGLDRSFEKWKAQNHRMYRQHCRAYSSGTYRLVRVKGSSTTVGLRNYKGGWVSGKVTAAKIKPRTELLVRLTSTDGKKVYRTAMTDGGGRFKVTGLTSGRYTVVVNADSWRGISRSFKGAHTVKVSRGKGKSVGTLRFKQ